MSDFRVWANSLSDTERDYYLAVGLLCDHWQFAEDTAFYLAAELLHMQEDNATILLRHLGNIGVRDVINELSESTATAPELKAFISHCTKCFDVCRANRNAIVHSWFSGHRGSGDHSRFVSKADKHRPKRREFFATVADIARVAQECHAIALNLDHAAWVVCALWNNAEDAKPDLALLSSLIEEFPLPKSLVGNQQNGNTPQAPPQSFQA